MKWVRFEILCARSNRAERPIGSGPSIFPPRARRNTMTPEIDPLLLASFFDDELDPATRAELNSVILANPTARQDLAGMAKVRESVASLPLSPPLADVSRAVLSRLTNQRRTSRIRMAAVTSVVLALAASLLVMVKVGGWESAHTGPVQPRSASPSSIVAARPTPLIPVFTSSPRSVRPIMAMESTSEAIRPGVLAAELKRRDDRSSLDALIASGNPRRVDIVVDEIGPAVAALEIIVDTANRTRPKHAKVQIAHNVDPSRPGACVFVLVMDDPEYEQFQTALNERFPDATKPQPADDVVIGSLGSVGRIEINPGKGPVAVLTDPPAKAKAGNARLDAPRDAKNEVMIDVDGNKIQLAPGAGGRNMGVMPKKPSRKPKITETAVYLVWVTPRERGMP